MTDNFPRGKLSDEDEGGLEIGVTVRDRTVIINFFKPVVWIGLDRATCLAFAEGLKKHAESIR